MILHYWQYRLNIGFSRGCFLDVINIARRSGFWFSSVFSGSLLESPKPSSYFFRCFAGLWFSRRCVAVFLRNTHFLVKMLPLENHKLWEFSLENPKPSSYFCSCFFRCFAGLWFSRRCLAVFQRKTNFLVKKVPSRKSQTLRISFRESQTAQPVLTGH